MAIPTQYELTYSVRQFAKMGHDLFFDLRVQRKANVWDLKRKSLFIQTLMQGLPFPVVYARKEGNRLDFLDGKQRLKTATLPFIDDGYRLHEDTPPVELDDEEYEVAGKFFSELPEELRERILNTNFSITALEDISDEQIDTLFFRLNNGVSLTRIELIRSLAGAKVLDFVEELAKEHFFAQSVNLTKTVRERYGDQELILQIMALVFNNGEAVDLSGDSLEESAIALNKEGIPEQLKETMRNTTGYLNEAFTVNDKMLKKTHARLLFVYAMKAMEIGIVPQKFAGWAQGFLITRHEGSKYATLTKGSTAKIDKIREQLKTMGEDFKKYAKKAPMYNPPTESPSGQRGRRKKQ